MSYIRYDNPASRGRKERMNAFQRFVSENRKSKPYRQMIAIFALEHGLRECLVKEYLSLLTRSGLYKIKHSMLLSIEEWKEEVEKEMKEREATRLANERMKTEAELDDEFQPPKIEEDAGYRE